MYLGTSTPMGSRIKKPIVQRRAWFRAWTSRGDKGNDVLESDMVWCRKVGHRALYKYIFILHPQPGDRG